MKVEFYLRLLSPMVLIAAWEIGARFEWLNVYVLPAPSDVLKAMYAEAVHGSLAQHLFSSLQRVVVGFLIGASAAVLVAVCCLNRIARSLLAPPLEILRPIPPLAWIGIAILAFGYGNPPAYFLTSLGAFFPTLTGAWSGLTLPDKRTVETAFSHGMPATRVFWHVMVPQALPSLLAGLKTGLGVSWMIVVTAELVGAQDGLGYLIQISRAQLEPEMVLGSMVLIGTVGALISILMNALERCITPWRFRGKKGVAA